MTRYCNNYRREHTFFLQSFFSIKPNGIDFYNPNNIGFEFKETYAKKERDMFFKVPKKQVDIADYFVFCENTTRFYIVDSVMLSENYRYNTKQQNAFIRIQMVRKHCLYEFNNIYELREFINKMERVK